jgi:hypothetical protein
MPPKAKANFSAAPQRSIMSFFGGGAAAKAPTKPTAATPTAKKLMMSAAEPMDLTTTPPKATGEPDGKDPIPATTPETVIQAGVEAKEAERTAHAGGGEVASGADDFFFGSTFSHRGPNDVWEVYGAAANAAVAEAMAASPNGGVVALPDAPAFEVRWGAAATSAKMPAVSSTGLIQVCASLRARTQTHARARIA